VRSRVAVFIAALAVGLGGLVPARGAAVVGQQAALDYCTPGGGPLGTFTDTEHKVLSPEVPLPAGVRRTRETVDGVSTPVMQAGPSNASEAVVFLHGNPGSSRDFDQFVAAVGPFARAVAWDMPGFGHSDKPWGGPYTTAGAARFIGDMLDHLGISRVHFVLHDFGGLWALVWSAEHTNRLASVTLIDSGVLTNYIPHPFAVIWGTPVLGEISIGTTTRQGFDETMQLTNPRPLPDAFVNRMYDDFDRGTRCAVLSYYRDYAGSSPLTDAPARFAAQQQTFSKLHLPALVIWGEKDAYIPASQAENQKNSFPQAEIHVLANAGHFPYVDEPDLTRSLIVSFLRRVLRRAAPTKATLSSLRETNNVFAVARGSAPLTGRTAARRAKQGTVFSFRLDQPATVKITIQTNAAGRRVDRKCRPPARRLRHKPRCTRTTTIATLTRTGHTRLNQVAFTGRIRGRALKPGRYQAAFTAIDAAGACTPKTLRFTIVKR
jgi:pimeloyl-ACP methyl ester carboxylesterase